MMEQMTKSDLRTGMHVVLRNGDEMVVMKDTKADGEGIVNLPSNPSDSGTWCDLANYNDNMTHMHYCDGDSMSDFDIVRVYAIAIYDDAVFKAIKDNHEYDDALIYAEETMTRAEAERKLGVRIID